MTWEKEVEKGKLRRRLLEKGGDPERIERQHKQGKLTVRERVAALVDPGSFQEIGGLAGNDTFEGEKLTSVMPIGELYGWCTLNGRKVLVSGEDSTVRIDIPQGGGETLSLVRWTLLEAMALQWHVPYVRLMDGHGASVRHTEATKRPAFVSQNNWIEISSRIMAAVPVVSNILGPSAGHAAINGCLCHFNVIVKNTGQVFPGGPPVVKVALGYEVTKEDLGGWQISASAGTVDRVAETEQEAFTITKQFLSYMPDSVWDMPPRVDTVDRPDRRDGELLSIVPDTGNRTYDPSDILKHVFDRGSVFELTPAYGTSRITALARVNGYPVGVVACNPASPSRGALDAAGAEKIIRFLHLLDTFHLPVVCFVDEPGYASGLEAEKGGIIRAAARLVQAIYQTKTPWISILVGEACGVAGSLMFRPGSMFKRYAWPSARWFSTRYGREAMPLNRMVDAFAIQDIIDPRDTRPLLSEFVEAAQKIVKGQLGPALGPSYRP